VRIPPPPARLVLRTSPEIEAKIDVLLDGQKVGQLVLPGVPRGKNRAVTPRGSVTWVEPSLDLPAGEARKATLELVAAEGAFVDYHVWIVAGGGDGSSDWR
jgi:hypothetical protein